MPASASTTGTEAQFEAQLRAAIVHAFPWLPSGEITHQDSFSLKFGHAQVTVNAMAKDQARARADVLLKFKGVALAIFELKRPGLRLTRDDEEQGLSYARALHPRPPLVVVSNGKDIRILETHSAKPWTPQTMSEVTLAALVERGTEVAQADLKRAVEILMGTDPDIWWQAVRQATSRAIDDKTGDWSNPLAPFVRSFLLPRKAVAGTYHLLKNRHRLIVLEGGPLSGKSTALRELGMQTMSDPTLAVLYLDADGGMNLFERLAMMLSDSFNWPVTPDEARHWLVNLSRSNGPTLVLAIDNVAPDRDDLRRDIETLSTNLFGPALRVVLAVDDVVAEQLTKQRTGRGPSALGRRAVRINLGPLDNDEFQAAEEHLSAQRLTFTSGARYSSELRSPWLIRSMATHAASENEYQNEKLVAVMSPVPGLEIVSHARESFDVSQAPFSRYRELAKAVLEDASDASRPYQLMLELLGTFVVRRSTIFTLLDAEEIRTLQNSGLIRETRSHSGENIYVIRVPELIASELAKLIAEQVVEASAKDPVEAAELLVRFADNLPLGDIITAQAIIDGAIQNQGLSIQVVVALRQRPPSRASVAVGTRVAGLMPGVGVVNMTTKEGGALLIEHKGRQQLIEPDEDESGPQVTLNDLSPYLILSHLAGHAFQVIGTQTVPAPRLDPDLLAGVGSSPIVLRRPGGDPDVTAVPIHEISDELSITCHDAGVVEPITWSLVRFFGHEEQLMREQFLDYALERPEPALLARLDIALRQTAGSADTLRAQWASSVRKKRLNPLLKESLGTYLHE